MIVAIRSVADRSSMADELIDCRRKALVVGGKS